MRRESSSFDLLHVALGQLGIGGRAGFGLAIDHRQGDEIGEAKWFDISLDRLRWPTPSPIQEVVAAPMRAAGGAFGSSMTFSRVAIALAVRAFAASFTSWMTC